MRARGCPGGTRHIILRCGLYWAAGYWAERANISGGTPLDITESRKQNCKVSKCSQFHTLPSMKYLFKWFGHDKISAKDQMRTIEF